MASIYSSILWLVCHWLFLNLYLKNNWFYYFLFKQTWFLCIQYMFHNSHERMCLYHSQIMELVLCTPCRSSHHLLIVFVLWCHAWKISLFTRISFAKIYQFSIYILYFHVWKILQRISKCFLNIVWAHYCRILWNDTKTSNVLQCVLVKHERNWSYKLSLDTFKTLHNPLSWNCQNKFIQIQLLKCHFFGNFHKILQKYCSFINRFLHLTTPDNY